MGSKLAILGANLRGNIGDFALLHAALADLQAKFPTHQVDVYTHPFHAVDERRLAAFRAVSKLDFEVAGQTYFRDPPANRLSALARKAGFWPAIQRRLIRSVAARADTQAKSFAQYDAIFIVGGAHWNGITVGISMFGTLEAVYRYNQNISAYPFSFGSGLERFNYATDIRRYFSRLRRPLVVRNSSSKVALERLNIRSELGADSVFSLVGEAAKLEPTPGRDRSRILVAITRPDPENLRALVARTRASGRDVWLMTTSWKEDEQDVLTAADQLGLRYLAPETWQEGVCEIMASSLLVTNRLHGLIFSCLARTPALPITNREKISSFARDARMPYSAVDLGGRTPDLVLQCLSHGDQILSAMDRYRTAGREMLLSPLGSQT